MIMLELFFNLVIIALAALSLFFLYYQARVYQEQKKLINRETEALKMLRHKNMDALRSRFRIKKVKLEV